MSDADLRVSGMAARIIVANAVALLRKQYRGRVLWALVSDLTGHGSTLSVAVCRSAGFDPNQTIGAAPLKLIPPLE